MQVSPCEQPFLKHWKLYATTAIIRTIVDQTNYYHSKLKKIFKEKILKVKDYTKLNILQLD